MSSAQNALLKTLEEPPASSVFILLTTMPELLLATVRSRCIRLTFPSAADAAADEEAREVAQRALLQAASLRDPARRIDAAKELHPKAGDTGAAGREQLASYLRAMASLLRDAEVMAAGSTVDLANADLAPVIERLAQTYGGDRGVKAFAAVDRALDALDRNAGSKVVADWVMLQL
jgi:DNA polymerase-3 subunit delta'